LSLSGTSACDFTVTILSALPTLAFDARRHQRKMPVGAVGAAPARV
jgi:hypothetical protein